jgi:hypothetical protein
MSGGGENTIDYWKDKHEALSSEFDDFQRQSAELENELELELQQEKDKCKELQKASARLYADNETLKSRLNEMNASTHKQISQLHEQIAHYKHDTELKAKYIRELEQKNDDLERNNRYAQSC